MTAVRDAIGIVGTVVSCAVACGSEALPPRLSRPEYAGEPTAFRCESIAEPRSPIAADNPLSFDRLADWKKEGIFAGGQPIRADSVRAGAIRPRWPKRETSKRLVPIGGTYWTETPFPVVRPTAKWVSSGFSDGDDVAAARGKDADTGTLTSPVKRIGTDDRYLHFSIGGGADRSGVRVELQVRVRGQTDAEKEADRFQLETCDAERRKQTSAPTGAVPDFVTVFERAGDGSEVLERGVVSLGPCLFLLNGREAQIRIVDESTEAHINVADVYFSASAESPRGPKVWGLADYHVHPAAHVGFGGLQGIHTVWGAPGRSIDDYVPGSPAARANLARDIPSCDTHKKWNGHHGGLAASKAINVSEYRTSEDPADLGYHELADDHGQFGAPKFTDFPDFRSGAHQQHHITQIYRAYLGGLRLMSALAVHNPGLEYGMGWVTCGKDGKPHVKTTPDLTVVEAHVEVMRELAALNSDWMAIAYTPKEAREIIARNKLAIVLGIEVAQLGHPADGLVPAQVHRLASLGIRQVTPIHSADNALGGTALFVDMYNSVNDLLNRPPEIRDQVVEVSGAFSNQPFGPHAFFAVEEAGVRDEPVLFRLVNPRRIVISDTFPHPGPCSFEVPGLGITSGCLHPFVNVSPKWMTPAILYDQKQKGHVNALGLTGRGREYIANLMSRGMLVDLAHMSDKSRDAALDGSRQIGCGKYPFMFSHAGFRQLMFRGDYSDRTEELVKETAELVLSSSKYKPPDLSACIQDPRTCPKLRAAVEKVIGSKPLQPGTVNRGLLPKEFDLPTKAVDEIDARRGVIGVFLGQDPIDSSRFAPGDFPRGTSGLPPSLNDCAGSSKSFAAALLFANAHHPTDGVGIASDFVMHMTVAPRFGRFACALYLKAGKGSQAAVQLLETQLNPSQYNFAQSNRVEYRPASAGPRPDDGSDARLAPYEMGDRTYDFNVDGLAHYGLLPDMLQDVRNVGVTDLSALFRSAEGYVQMWERAWEAAGCNEHPDECNPARSLLVPAATCGDTCPNSWNAGAPLQNKKELEYVCDPGEEIRIRGASARFAPSQRALLLRRQGDWAVFELPATQRVWSCGTDQPVPLECPNDTHYLKVRRVFESRVGANLTCDEPPGYPMAGSRRVIFQCLARSGS